MPVMTPERSRLQQMLEPVYALATHIYNASTVGRLNMAALAEGLVKGDHYEAGGPLRSYPPQDAPGLHETVQSVYARATITTQTVAEQQYDTGTVNLIPGV